MSADLLDHCRRPWCSLCETDHEPCLHDELTPLPYCGYCGTFGHEAFDCDERPIQQRQTGPRREGRGQPITYPQLHDRVLLAYWVEAGLTYDQMAARIGCSRPALSNAIAGFGLVRRPRRDLVHPVLSNRDWLAEHCDGSLSLQGIADAAGASKPSVRKWLVRHDLYDMFTANRLVWLPADKARRDAEREANKPGPRFPQLRDLDWLAAAVADRGCAVVAREVGCHVSSVMHAMHRHGLEYEARVGKGQRAPHPARETALALYAEGCTMQEVADAAGLNHTTVGKWVQEAGISRPKGRPRKPGRDKAFELYAAGATLAEAGAAVGVTGSSVAHWLHEEGLPTRPAGRPRHDVL